MHSGNLRLKMSRHHLFYGLLLFAATWGVIPITVICITYHIPSNHLWLTILIDSIFYFFLGLLVGLFSFGSLRLWQIWRGNQGGWFIPIFVFSFILCVLETILVGTSLITAASQMIGLIISSIFSHAYWLK